MCETSREVPSGRRLAPPWQLAVLTWQRLRRVERKQGTSNGQQKRIQATKKTWRRSAKFSLGWAREVSG